MVDKLLLVSVLLVGAVYIGFNSDGLRAILFNDVLCGLMLVYTYTESDVKPSYSLS
ncbi:hypothetical protein JI666_19360 [Bacillus sp. NTK071]|uniref:hypothetical protein n=1 Tax=Bacillus sp. NTK071 TaxID=2802175 RepID=UPI001A8EC96A|nr:hypothetical protein [Bacillus sp. NTK071]MBN8210910.1 hypothetical protein [Bacillus sp. NTK071]